MRDIPDLRGIIIAKIGFQEGAERFGESKGIVMLQGTQFPNLAEAIGIAIEAAFLPLANTKGEPFWILMEVNREHESTGILYAFSDPKTIRKTVPLFLSRTHALAFLLRRNIVGFEVRGLKKNQLKAYLQVSKNDQIDFASYFINPPPDQNFPALLRISRDELIRDFC